MSSWSFRRFISSLALVRDCSSERPRFRPKILMLSSIDRSGMRASSWGTNPSFALEKILLWPKILIFPECFLEMIPEMIFRKVDFPQPDFPIMLTSSPSFRFRVTSFRISLSEYEKPTASLVRGLFFCFSLFRNFILVKGGLGLYLLGVLMWSIVVYLICGVV